MNFVCHVVLGHTSLLLHYYSTMTTLCNIEMDVPNAPDLVLDLLAANQGAVPGHVLCRAGILLGHQETAMRVAITRLFASGKIRRVARGQYCLNQRNLTLSAALDGWRREASEQVPWHGHWVAIHDGTVPRADKTQWRHHQLALSLRGFASFQPGLQVRPNNRAGGVDEERRRLIQLGLAPSASVFALSGWTPAEVTRAERLWPVAALQTQYRMLLDALNTHIAELDQLEPERGMIESLLLGRTAMAQLVRDPMLPEELMSADIRTALIDRLKHYNVQAHALWCAVMGLPGEPVTQPD